MDKMGRIKCLTKNQLFAACEKNDYIVARSHANTLLAVNCKFVVSKKDTIDKSARESNYVGYYPCSFMEYITHKRPFLKSI